MVRKLYSFWPWIDLHYRASIKIKNSSQIYITSDRFFGYIQRKTLIIYISIKQYTQTCWYLIFKFYYTSEICKNFGIGLNPDSAMLQDIDCNLFKVNTIEDLFCFVLCFLLHLYCLSDTHHLLVFTARL